MPLPSLTLFMDEQGRLIICAGTICETYEHWKSSTSISRAKTTGF